MSYFLGAPKNALPGSPLETDAGVEAVGRDRMNSQAPAMVATQTATTMMRTEGFTIAGACPGRRTSTAPPI